MKIKNIIFCGLFAALTAVFSQIALPLPFSPVVISLSTLSVLTCGGVLGFKYGTLSQTIYVLLGAVGLPVFSRLSGGIGILTGPVGGFLYGYILCAAAVGLFRKYCKKTLHYAAVCTAGLLLCYTTGIMQYMYVTSNHFAAALSACVIPFIPGDLLKIYAAALIIPRLKIHRIKP